MLAVPPLRSCKDERLQSEMESCCFATATTNGEGGGGGEDDHFPDFSCGNLLDSIDFDDLFVGINDEDVLPDLEMDPEILAEFSLSSNESSEITTTTHESSLLSTEKLVEESSANNKVVEVDKAITSINDDDGQNNNSDMYFSTLGAHHLSAEDVAAVSKSSSSSDDYSVANPSHKDGDMKAKKSPSSQSKNSQGKRKVKVDWTPELHRRFVQAVEQLGVDKAVPSRILELMGIDCLTRHNIASHLQKYRSHRKHLLAREAEAANWTQRRQIYGGAPPPAAAATTGGGGGKREMSPWLAPTPTMGFPPMAPVPHFRPLHVWGHPSVDQTLMPIWPKHLGPSPSPPLPPHAAWPPSAVPPPPPPDPTSFWHSHHQRVPNPLTPGTPCFPPHLAPTRFPSPPVPGIPPPAAMYKVDPAGSIGVPTTTTTGTLPQAPIDFHPSKESIDAAIGDVLSKPWLPLPLGLKPPSVDGVMVELQRQGISKIPPTTSCA